VPPLLALAELNMDWASCEAASRFELCPSCQPDSFIFPCAVCGEEGPLLLSERGREYRGLKPGEGPAPRSGRGVYACQWHACDCGHFYHIECLYSEQHRGKFADVRGKRTRDLSEVSLDFRCPAHYCQSCKYSDGRHSQMKSTGCVRCYHSYHESCIGKEQFLKLNGQYFICSSHLRHPQEVDSIANEFRMLALTSRDKAYLASIDRQEGKRKGEPMSEEGALD
jgi:hypothetical protein